MKRIIVRIPVWAFLCACFILSTAVMASADQKKYKITNSMETSISCDVYMYFKNSSGRQEFTVKKSETVTRKSEKCLTELSGYCTINCQLVGQGMSCSGPAITRLSGLNVCRDARYEIQLPSGSDSPVFVKVE